MADNMIPAVEAWLEDVAHPLIITALDTLDGDKPFLSRESIARIATDLSFALVLDRLSLTESDFADALIEYELRQPSESGERGSR